LTEENWKLPSSARLERPLYKYQWGKIRTPTGDRFRWWDDEAKQAAEKAYAAIDPKAVDFIAREYAEAIIESLKKHSEKSVNFMDLVVNFTAPTRIRNFDERKIIFKPYKRLVNRVREITRKNDQKENIRDFVEMEAISLARQKVMEYFRDADFEIRIYGTVRAYGGPEEGGWWYTHRDLVKRIPVKGLKPAYRKYLQTKEYVKDKGEDNFYRDIQAPSNDIRMSSPEDDYEQEGMWIAKGWKPSGHEKYFATLNLKGALTQTTRKPPRYS
jgi:hypothetical protein